MATATTPGLNAPPLSPQTNTQAPQQASGMQAPASPIMQLLSNWHRVAGEIGEHHPQIASMLQKVASATQESLMILAREAVGQQQQGLPTNQAQPRGEPQETAQPQGYPPSSY